MFHSIVTGFALVAAANAAVHSIDVGNGGIKFSPNSLTADVGDLLEFHFYSGTGGHSVVSSTFSSPCVPEANAFFSGYIPGSSTGEMTFVVNVTSTDPIWFYCSLATHCQSGMAGVVNPPSGSTITDYVNAAHSVAKASAPASEEGGVLTSIADTAAASTSAASVSSSASVVMTSASSSASMTGTASSTTSAGSTAATTKASAAGRSELNVLLGVGVFAAGLVALMA